MALEAAAGLGVASAGFGFMSKMFFEDMAKQAGKTIQIAGVEARETAREVGRVANATIEKADSAAQNVLRAMSARIRETVEHTRRSSEELVQVVGMEGRLTAEHFKLQAQDTLRLASAESKVLLAKLGTESRDVIRTGGKEFRKTGLLLSGEINQQIRTASEEAKSVLRSGGDEVERILAAATENLSRLTIETSEQYQIVVTALLRQFENSLKGTCDNVFRNLNSLTDQLSREANGLILNFADHGRLLIRDTGHEIRITADKILTDFFAGQELVIASAGVEARLAIQTVGTELRSTLYEIPYIAGKAGEHLARGLSFGFMDQLYGLKDIDKRIHRLVTYFAQEKASIEKAVRYVYMQEDLPPHVKFRLYKALVDIINIPENTDDMRKILIFIGVMALRDKGLHYTGMWGYRTINYCEQLVDQIPGEARAELKEHGEKTLWALYPPKVFAAPALAGFDEADAGQLEEQLDQKEIELAELRKGVEIERGKNLLLNFEKASEHLILEQTQERLAQIEENYRQRVEELTRDHRNRVQVLEEEKNALSLQLNKLARVASGESDE